MRINYKDIELLKLPAHIHNVMDVILEREGEKYTYHENDWPTKWGVRQLSADRAGYTGRIQDIDRNTAEAIWISLFWYGPNLHLISKVSPVIARTILDTSGPAGLKVGITHLQKSLTSFNFVLGSHYIYGPDLKIDGLIGKKTIKQLSLYMAHRKRSKGVKKMAVRLNCLQDAHYVEVALRDPKKRSFSFGWTSQRVFTDLMDLAQDTDRIEV